MTTEALTSPSPAPPSPATPLLAAIPIAVALVVLCEVLRVPAARLFESATSPLQMLALGLRAAVDFLWAPTLFQLCVAGMAGARSAKLRSGGVSWLLSVAAAGAICAFCYAGLTTYAPFRGHVPLIALFVALFAFLLVWQRLVLALTRPTTRRAHVGRWALALVGLCGFAVITWLNRTLYPDAYPTLHRSIVQVSYVCLLCGLASVRIALPGAPQTSRALRWVVGIALLHCALLAQPIIDAGWCDAAQPAFRRFTDLGRAYALQPHAQALAATPQSDAQKPLTVDDPDALARFRAHANLPDLPADFDLTRYNVLVVSVDALRYRETAMFEGRPGVTPHLWALRERGGYWFERAYSPAPSTLQSFSALFAMTYPSMLQLTQETPWHGELSAKETTVASLFKSAGYRTFYAGHNFRLHHGHGAKIRGLLQGFDDLRLAPGGHDAPQDPNQDAIILAGAKAALETQRDALASRGRGRFFGWIFFESPHAPYLTHYADMPSATPHERYRQEVRYVDEQLGALFADLERTGLMRETVVILLSDHGEGFGLHERLRHADVYEEITHVPLAIWVPGAQPQRITAPTSTLYVFPWLLQRGTPAMRAAAQTRLRAHLGPMLEHTDGAILSELRCHDCARTALVYPDHRVIYDFPSGYVERYDRATDPDEQHNVDDTGTGHSLALRRRLQGYLRVRGTGHAATEPRR